MLVSVAGVQPPDIGNGRSRHRHQFRIIHEVAAHHRYMPIQLPYAEVQIYRFTASY